MAHKPWMPYIVVSAFAIALFGYGFEGWERIISPALMVGAGYLTGRVVQNLLDQEELKARAPGSERFIADMMTKGRMERIFRKIKR